MKPYWKILIDGQKINVKVLRTNDEKEKGYQYCQIQPSASDGLLFLFSNEQQRTFHMKNVLFDLSLIGADTSGKVVCNFIMSPGNNTYTTPPCKFIIETSKDVSKNISKGCFLKVDLH